ncbi:MAG: hypothetical protein GF313_06630 [Caldithrix sp.]|nr:hypothetical protein [Caldithrix sp.]
MKKRKQAKNRLTTRESRGNNHQQYEYQEAGNSRKELQYPPTRDECKNQFLKHHLGGMVV